MLLYICNKEREVNDMLTINNLMKPQLIIPKFYFVSNLGEVLFDSETDSREKRKEFLRNYGNCRITKISEYNHYISFEFNLPHCPICDIDCPYFWSEGMGHYCTCDNPIDNCDECSYAMGL
jgi:hypothetical protein